MTAEDDRLSNLSDDIITKILSYIKTKDAIKTSILSSRWKNIWKSIPHLDLFKYPVDSLPKFYEYVNRVLSSRNSEIELSSVKLTIYGEVSHTFFKKILKHNVEKMTIIYSPSTSIKLPLSLFISHSLRDLSLTGFSDHIMINSSWDLLTLTTLHLDHVMFGDRNRNHDEFGGLFSKCPNLKNLTLTNCSINVDDFTVNHYQFSNLTLENGENGHSSYFVNVVAPHLKDLTFVNFRGNLMISAPELSSLMYESVDYFEFSASGLSSLEKVEFYISRPNEEDAPKIVEVLQQFGNVKYLTLGLEIVEVLESNVQLVSQLPSPFANLTSLKIYPKNLRLVEEGQKKINIPTEVKNYLLDASLSTNVMIFSRQEAQALQNVTLAQKKFAELQLLLEPWETNNNGHMDLSKQGETQIDEEKHVKEKISQMENFSWFCLKMMIDYRRDMIQDILATLYCIEKLLDNLPASKKDRIHARFSSLREQAYNVIKLIMDGLRINIDEMVSPIMN